MSKEIRALRIKGVIKRHRIPKKVQYELTEFREWCMDKYRLDDIYEVKYTYYHPYLDIKEEAVTVTNDEDLKIMFETEDLSTIIITDKDSREEKEEQKNKESRTEYEAMNILHIEEQKNKENRTEYEAMNILHIEEQKNKESRTEYEAMNILHESIPYINQYPSSSLHTKDQYASSSKYINDRSETPESNKEYPKHHEINDIWTETRRHSSNDKKYPKYHAINDIWTEARHALNDKKHAARYEVPNMLLGADLRRRIAEFGIMKVKGKHETEVEEKHVNSVLPTDHHQQKGEPPPRYIMKHNGIKANKTRIELDIPVTDNVLTIKERIEDKHVNNTSDVPSKQIIRTSTKCANHDNLSETNTTQNRIKDVLKRKNREQLSEIETPFSKNDLLKAGDDDGDDTKDALVAFRENMKIMKASNDDMTPECNLLDKLGSSRCEWGYDNGDNESKADKAVIIPKPPDPPEEDEEQGIKDGEEDLLESQELEYTEKSDDIEAELENEEKLVNSDEFAKELDSAINVLEITKIEQEKIVTNAAATDKEFTGGEAIDNIIADTFKVFSIDQEIETETEEQYVDVDPDEYRGLLITCLYPQIYDEYYIYNGNGGVLCCDIKAMIRQYIGNNNGDDMDISSDFFNVFEPPDPLDPALGSSILYENNDADFQRYRQNRYQNIIENGKRCKCIVGFKSTTTKRAQDHEQRVINTNLDDNYSNISIKYKSDQIRRKSDVLSSNNANKAKVMRSNDDKRSNRRQFLQTLDDDETKNDPDSVTPILTSLYGSNEHTEYQLYTENEITSGLLQYNGLDNISDSDKDMIKSLHSEANIILNEINKNAKGVIRHKVRTLFLSPYSKQDIDDDDDDIYNILMDKLSVDLIHSKPSDITVGTHDDDEKLFVECKKENDITQRYNKSAVPLLIEEDLTQCPNTTLDLCRYSLNVSSLNVSAITNKADLVINSNEHNPSTLPFNICSYLRFIKDELTDLSEKLPKVWNNQQILSHLMQKSFPLQISFYLSRFKGNDIENLLPRELAMNGYNILLSVALNHKLSSITKACILMHWMQFKLKYYNEYDLFVFIEYLRILKKRRYNAESRHNVVKNDDIDDDETYKDEETFKNTFDIEAQYLIEIFDTKWTMHWNATINGINGKYSMSSKWSEERGQNNKDNSMCGGSMSFIDVHPPKILSLQYLLWNKSDLFTELSAVCLNKNDDVVDEMKNKIIFKFDETKNKEKYPIKDAEITLSLNVKKLSCDRLNEILIHIFEMNTSSYHRDKMREFDITMNLLHITFTKHPLQNMMNCLNVIDKYNIQYDATSRIDHILSLVLWSDYRLISSVLTEQFILQKQSNNSSGIVLELTNWEKVLYFNCPFISYFATENERLLVQPPFLDKHCNYYVNIWSTYNLTENEGYRESVLVLNILKMVSNNYLIEIDAAEQCIIIIKYLISKKLAGCGGIQCRPDVLSTANEWSNSVFSKYKKRVYYLKSKLKILKEIETEHHQITHQLLSIRNELGKKQRANIIVKQKLDPFDVDIYTLNTNKRENDRTLKGDKVLQSDNKQYKCYLVKLNEINEILYKSAKSFEPLNVNVLSIEYDAVTVEWDLSMNKRVYKDYYGYFVLEKERIIQRLIELHNKRKNDLVTRWASVIPSNQDPNYLFTRDLCKITPNTARPLLQDPVQTNKEEASSSHNDDPLITLNPLNQIPSKNTLSQSKQYWFIIRDKMKEFDITTNMDEPNSKYCYLIPIKDNDFNPFEIQTYSVSVPKELINKRRVYIIDCILNGIQTRTMIKISDIKYIQRITSAGHCFDPLDEENKMILPKNTKINISMDPLINQAIIIQREDAPHPNVLLHFNHLKERYSFIGNAYMDREQVLQKERGELIIQGTRYIENRSNKCQIPLKLIQNVKLETNIKTQNADIDKTVNDLTLNNDKETVVSTLIPPKTRIIKDKLNGEIKLIHSTKVGDQRNQFVQINKELTINCLIILENVILLLITEYPGFNYKDELIIYRTMNLVI